MFAVIYVKPLFLKRDYGIVFNFVLFYFILRCCCYRLSEAVSRLLFFKTKLPNTVAYAKRRGMNSLVGYGVSSDSDSDEGGNADGDG